jgi:hypothetical protein
MAAMTAARMVASPTGPLPVRLAAVSSPKVTSQAFSRGGAWPAELDLRVSAGQRLMVMKLPDATGVVQLPRGVSAWCRGLVEPGHQLAVGGAGGYEFVVAFFELQAQAGGLLLEVGDFLVERVDVGGGTES